MDNNNNIRTAERDNPTPTSEVQNVASSPATTWSVLSSLQDFYTLSSLITPYFFHPILAVQIYFPNMWPFGGAVFKPDSDIGDLNGKVILVTGGKKPKNFQH